MNKPIKQHLRFISLCIVALLLAVCMATLLVACGNTDNNNQNNSENNGNSISEENATLAIEYLDRLVAYGTTQYSSFIITFRIFNDGVISMTSQNEYGNGFFSYLSLNEFSNHHSQNVYLYDSEENASLQKHRMDEQGIITDTYKCFQNGKALIVGFQQDGIESFASFTPDQSTVFSTEHDSAKNTLSSLLSQNNFDALGWEETYMNNTIDYINLQSMPKIGNCYETYAWAISNSSLNTSTFINGIGNEFTDDSYAKFENDNFYAHVKYKASGLTYEDNGDSYTLTGYRYDSVEGYNVIIPSEYNEKPVTKIGNCAFVSCYNITSVSIPISVVSIGRSAFDECYGLTNITYQGTIAEWNAITKNEYWNYDVGDIVIHCADGDLDKNGNEI